MNKLEQLEQIIDDDSSTNFQFETKGIQLACGYSFCRISETSTQVQLSDDHSDNQYGKNIHNKQIQKQKVNKQQLFDDRADKLFQEIEKQYSEHRIDSAYELIQQYHSLTSKQQGNSEPIQNQLFTKIKRQMKDVQYYQEILIDDNQNTNMKWKLQKQNKNLKVSSKIQGETVGVLIQGFIDVPLQNFLSVVAEIDLVKEYMPFMTKSKLLKKVSRNCRIGYCMNQFPMLDRRQAFFQGIGYDRMKYNGTVFMYTRSLNDQLQFELQYKCEETPGVVQLNYKYFVLEYRPLTAKTGNIKFAMNVDLKLKLPMFILKSAVQNFGIDFYENILKISRKFKGSKWQKKMLEDPEFFNFFRDIKRETNFKR